MIFNVSNWMEVEKCIPSDFFRNSVSFLAFINFLLYYTFSYAVYTKLKSKLDALMKSNFSNRLAIVFILCGLCYLIMSLGMQETYFKLGYFIILPFLVFFQALLLLDSAKSVNRFLKVSTPEYTQKLKFLLEESSQDQESFQEELQSKDLKIARLESIIYNSYNRKNFASIASYIEEQKTK